jgi:hypothetical protein
MKTIKIITALIFVLLAQSAASQTKNDSLYNYYNDSSYTKMRDSLMKSYTEQNKEYEKMMKKQESKKRGLGSSFFGLNLDVIFGVGISNTEFDLSKDTSGLGNTQAKTGPMVGVNLNFNLIGFAFSTGFNYSSKGFVANNSDVNANYINIPLMFAFNFDVGKVELDIAAGPYVGILISHDEQQAYEMKNFDIGIVGTLQGSYFFNRFMGALLGVKYEHGGLNNLLVEKNQTGSNISAIKTRNWFIYSGVKFVL